MAAAPPMDTAAFPSLGDGGGRPKPATWDKTKKPGLAPTPRPKPKAAPDTSFEQAWKTDVAPSKPVVFMNRLLQPQAVEPARGVGAAPTPAPVQDNRPSPWKRLEEETAEFEQQRATELQAKQASTASTWSNRYSALVNATPDGMHAAPPKPTGSRKMDNLFPSLPPPTKPKPAEKPRKSTGRGPALPASVDPSRIQIKPKMGQAAAKARKKAAAMARIEHSLSGGGDNFPAADKLRALCENTPGCDVSPPFEVALYLSLSLASACSSRGGPAANRSTRSTRKTRSSTRPRWTRWSAPASW